jgi:hypothetical protein
MFADMDGKSPQRAKLFFTHNCSIARPYVRVCLWAETCLRCTGCGVFESINAAFAYPEGTSSPIVRPSRTPPLPSSGSGRSLLV